MANSAAISIPATGRGKNYSDQELKQLCLSVLHVSQDPAVGNGQRAEKFWHRVQTHYNEHRPSAGEVRGRKSLESKWADLKHDVSKFIGCYNQVEERQTSGTNQEDTLAAAKELYKDNHPKGKSFTFEGAWNLLKDAPRWRIPIDDMARTKNTIVRGKSKRPSGIQKEGENGSPEINLETSDGETDAGTISLAGNPDLRRPMGNKRAKEENKRARMTKDSLRMSAEAQKDQAAATKKMAKAHWIRARTLENNSAIAVLAMPIDSFSPELKAFMQSWKLEEAIRLKQRMEASSSHNTAPTPEPAPPRPPRNPLPCVRQPVFPIPPGNGNQEGSTSIQHGEEEQGLRNPAQNIDEPSIGGEHGTVPRYDDGDAAFYRTLNEIAP